MYTGIQIQARNQNTGVHCAKGGKYRQRLDRAVMDTPHAGVQVQCIPRPFAPQV